MKLTICFLMLSLVVCVKVYGQTRTITGRVISENLEALPEVRIQSLDTVVLGTTNKEGKFEIEIPHTIDKLLISWLGMEWKTIQMPEQCNQLDIILMYHGSYDFMSARRIDRLRKKRFKKLSELHLAAFEKGLFTTKQPCYEHEFVPIREELKEIKRKGRTKTP
ncbi:hypothetical protein H7F15_05015 [Pontibacter sp. Tf4]|uniref:hypothetical protein n=1 Tax=Pontibacter sp. Tf4 TaxID=2761620 RepID=UPI0016281DCE|nr:hypothetical protein [Pontibacter sp. Tf4]MBB6610391.1 hypothetical protein [Pontibacter sp. Tf4]